jgi:hypothetical protein
VLSICGNSFKTVGKTFPVKLVAGMLSSRQRVANLNLKFKIYFDLFNTISFSTLFYLYYFIVLIYSLLLYNVENKIKI